MAKPTSSASSLLWRLFAVLALVLLLCLGWQGYQRYTQVVRENNYYHTDTYFRTVQDSVRKLLPGPAAKEVVVYRPAPADPRLALQVRANYDLLQQLRREFARQQPRPVVVVTKQKPPVVAMKDTILLRRNVATGQVVKTEAKTGTFRDQWLSLTGVVIPGKAGGPDSLQAKYTVRTDFDVQAYSQRTGKHWYTFWKPRVVRVQLKSKNPNTVVTGLDAVKVEKR